MAVPTDCRAHARDAIAFTIRDRGALPASSTDDAAVYRNPVGGCFRASGFFLHVSRSEP
jgi:hypothetical protein